MALYSEKVMDHFTNPRNVGKLDDADGIGEVGNARCGDIMKIYIKVDGDIITDVKFNTFGCGSAIASSSMATEMIKGKPIAQALELTNKAVAEALDGLPAHKLHPGALYHPVIPFTPVGIHRILTKISQIISVFFVRFVVYFLRQVEEARQCRNLSFLLNRGCSVDAPEPPGQSAPKPQSGFVPPPARAAFFYAGFRTNVSRETFRWFSHLQKGPLPFIIVPHDLIWRSSPCP